MTSYHVASVGLLLFALLTVSVNSHAMLSYPTAWVPNPVKNAPCGGLSDYPAGNQIVNLTIGDQLPVSWTVIASDGSGDVTAKYNLNGGVNTFTENWTGLTISAPQVGSFAGVAVVPNVTCSPTCTAQVSNAAGWVSCFSFRTGNFSAINNRESRPRHSTYPLICSSETMYTS